MNAPTLQRWTPRVIGLMLSATLVAGVAGVAAAAPNAKQLVTASFAKAVKTHAVTFTSTSTDSSGQTVGIHVTFDGKGNSMGTISLNGHTMQFVKIGAEDYFMGDADFWSSFGGTGASSAASVLAGKWFKASGSKSPLAGFKGANGVKAFLGSLPAVSSLSHVTVKHVTYHGKSAWAVKGSAGGQTGTIVVQANKPGYPLAVTTPTGKAAFSDWGKHVTVQAPAGAIDFNQFAG
jgi:hypothetical protein